MGDHTADAVLLMGPLYHLPEPHERLAALAEARRVFRPGGVVAATAITRFASVLDALDSGFIDDPVFMETVGADIVGGHHVNPTDNPDYFTTAYFHLPGELAAELDAAGFRSVEVLAAEGVGWIARDLPSRLADPTSRSSCST